MERPVILTIKQQVYQYLHDSILKGEFKPGQRINEVEIAQDLKVSRSPVHSAIGELIGEGLLESINNKSVIVRKLSEKQVLDIMDFRNLVETFAIKKVCEHMTLDIKQKLLEFRNSFLTNNTYDHLVSYTDTDSKFHCFLVDSAGNDIISETYHRYTVLLTPFRLISLESRKRFTESIPEHIGIIDAILAKNDEEAIGINKSHLHLAGEQIVSYFSKLSDPTTKEKHHQ